MSVLERTHGKKATEVTFVLPSGHPAGSTSVVGDFNSWEPGAHQFAGRPDGTRAVTIALPPGERFSFRYLADGDFWFDEDMADHHDGSNSVLHT